jgi:hypothetical protein
MEQVEGIPHDDVLTAMEYLAACTTTGAQAQYRDVLRAMTDVLICPIDEHSEIALRDIVGSSEREHLPTHDLLSAAEFAAVAHLAASDARRVELHESMRKLADMLARVQQHGEPVAA